MYLLYEEYNWKFSIFINFKLHYQVLQQCFRNLDAYLDQLTCFTRRCRQVLHLFMQLNGLLTSLLLLLSKIYLKHLAHRKELLYLIFPTINFRKQRCQLCDRIIFFKKVLGPFSMYCNELPHVLDEIPLFCCCTVFRDELLPW